MSAGKFAIRTIVAEHEGLVRAFFRRRCACPEDAEDLAQEAFCAIVDALPRFRGSSSASTWVWAICRNVLSRHLYKKRRDERVMEGLRTSMRGAESGRDEEERRAISLLLDSLRPAERRLYECYYGKGLRVREIARLFERPEGTIKYQLSMLRAGFRRIFDGNSP